MIIGLAGTFASGKDTLAHHLVQKYNFMHVSTGDMVRAVTLARYGNTERPVELRTANELRQEKGAGVFAELALEKYESEKDKYDGVVISGIRSLGEVEAIKAAGGKIVFTDSPIKVRYQRIKNRQRTNEEKLSLEEFKESEAKENFTVHDNPFIADIQGVKEVADTIVFNEEGVEPFIRDAEQKLEL